ncbi:MAG: hypothetical protein U0871_29865 [Gemmataceae bacterium]
MFFKLLVTFLAIWDEPGGLVLVGSPAGGGLVQLLLTSTIVSATLAVSLPFRASANSFCSFLTSTVARFRLRRFSLDRSRFQGVSSWHRTLGMNASVVCEVRLVVALTL